eukprot:g7591.t1
MTSKMKKFCSLFRCCVGQESSSNWTNKRVAFNNVNTPIGWQVTKEKRELFDFFISYQRLKLSDWSVQDWAVKAAQNAILLNLLESSMRFGEVGDSNGVELVCINAALVVYCLPDDSKEEFCMQFLNGFCEFLQQNETGRIGPLLMMSTLLRIQKIRTLVVRNSVLFTLFFQVYQNLVCSKSIPGQQSSKDSSSSSKIPENQEYEAEISDDSISDDSISEDSSIADQSITSESHPNDSPKSLPVPKLDFNCSSFGGVHCALPITNQAFNDSATGVRSDRWKSSGGLSGKHALLSSSRRCLCSGKAKLQSRCTEGSSAESLHMEAPVSDNAKITKMLSQMKINHQKNEAEAEERTMNEGLKSLRTIVQDLGLTKTIKLLASQNEMSFASIQTREFIDLEKQWNLDNEWAHDMTIEAESQEKIALLDIFLLLAAADDDDDDESSPPKLAVDICQTILTDFTQSLQKNNCTNPILIRRSIAAFLEYSNDRSLEIQNPQTKIQIFIPKSPTDLTDDLLKTLIHEIQKFNSINRIDTIALKRLEQVLNVISEYLAMSLFSPLHLIKCLVYPLDTLQALFCEFGDIEDWRNVHFDAFSAFLEPILLKELLKSLLCEEWISLLTSLSWWLTQGHDCWLNHNKRLRINLLIWSLLTVIAEAQMKLKESTKLSLLLEDFNSILAPRTGLVSKVLVYLDHHHHHQQQHPHHHHQSEEMNASLYAQVLGFLHASCFLIGGPFIDHEMEFEAYIKYICFKFIELYQLGNIESETETSLLALHLQVLTSMIINCPLQSTVHLLKLKFVELVMDDLQGIEVDLKSLTIPNPLLPQQFTPVEVYRSSSEESSKTTSINEGGGGDGLSLPPVHHLTRISLSSTTRHSFIETEGGGGVSIPQDEIEVELSSFNLNFEDIPTETLDRELFGRVSEEEEEVDEMHSIDSFSSDDSWPSDLSPTGDLDEDTLRLEICLLRKAYKQGRLTLEEMQAKVQETKAELLEHDQTNMQWVCQEEEDLSQRDERRVPSLSVNLPLIRRQSCTPPEFITMDTAQELQQPSCKTEETVVVQLLHFNQQFATVLNLENHKLQKSQLVKNDGVYLAAVEFLLHVLLMLDKCSSNEESCDLAVRLSSLLYQHINHLQFQHLTPCLIQLAQDRGPDSFRMLRLLLDGFFDINLYTEVDRIYKGEVAHVKRCRLTQSGEGQNSSEGIPQMCIVKVMDFPLEYQSPDVSLLNVYSEVNIMEKLHNETGFCQIYDYGLNGDTLYIVMENCEKSLQDWIHEFPTSRPWAVRLLLRVFKSIAQRVAQLHEMRMVHFDLKCSNILLKLRRSSSDNDPSVWYPETEYPQFEVVLADFGFSRCYQGQNTLATVRNRGTEPCKAPEMLQIRGTRKRKSQTTIMTEKTSEAGAPSDVWSLGCLLFELLTGEMLYSGQEWARFYTQLTQEDSPLFTEDKIQLLNASYRDQIKNLLKSILVRDQRKRPLIAEIIDKVDGLLEGETLPDYDPPHCDRVQHGSTTELVCSPRERSDTTHSSGSYLTSFVHELQFSLRLTTTTTSDDLWISVFFLSSHDDELVLVSDLTDFMDLLISSPPPLGVIYFIDQSLTEGGQLNDCQTQFSLLDNESQFYNKMKSIAAKKRLKTLLLSVECLEQDQQVHFILTQAIEEWRRSAGPEGRLVLCGNESEKSEILVLLLKLIKFFENCNSLQALSKLKGRISHGV